MLDLVKYWTKVKSTTFGWDHGDTLHWTLYQTSLRRFKHTLFAFFFFRTCFYFMFRFVFFFFSGYNWEAFKYFQRPTASIIKKSLQCSGLKCIMVNSISRIEIKWVKIVNENWQRIINNLTTELNNNRPRMKISLFKQLFPYKKFLVNCKFISTHCQS